MKKLCRYSKKLMSALLTITMIIAFIPLYQIETQALTTNELSSRYQSVVNGKYGTGKYFRDDQSKGCCFPSGSACHNNHNFNFVDDSYCNCKVATADIAGVAGGIQCFGYARYVFYQLFGLPVATSYSSDGYALGSTNNVKTIGQVSSGLTSSNVANVFSKAYLGDFIQTSYGSSGRHSMIVESVSSNAVTVLECNHSGRCAISRRTITFANFASAYKGFSVYRATNHPGGTPVTPSTSYTIDTKYPTPISAYTIPTGQVKTYWSVNGAEAGYIDGSSDLCTINEVYTNEWVKVTYPTNSGPKEAYTPLSNFVEYGGAVTPYTWSPSNSINAYVRSNMSEQFGTVFTTDSCKVVSTSGSKLQVIYPVYSGGYKLGWVNPSTSAPVTPEATRPSTTIPGPVASGAFSGKSIVAVAPNKITISTNPVAYISAGDICTITNVNPSTGYCDVTYPSGGSDVFASGVTKRTVSIPINHFINYNGAAQAEVAKIPNQLTVYPTQSMSNTVGSYTANWWLDPGDTYTTINNINGATEVLYYCSQGKHSGYWKLGWAWLDYYSLDLNGYLDNASQGGLMSYGTADVYINGIKRADDVTDFYTANGTYPKGSTYEIKDIRAYKGYTYNGVYSGSVSGTLTANTSVSLNFTKNPVTVAGIVVTANPTKTTYLEGESLNTSGLVVTANYSDGTSKNVTSSCAFSGYSSTPGDKTVKVTYSGKTTSFTVRVNSKSPTAISITSLPTKTSYFINEEFDSEGMVVKATYNNGTNSVVTNYDIYGFSSETSGTKTVTIYYTYNNITVSKTFTITVSDILVSSIAVKTNPTKTSYYVGDTLNTNGLTLTATYNNGTTETVSNSFTCTPTALNTAGTQKITVTYGGKSTTFNVTVTDVTVSSIAVKSNPTKTSYCVGDTLNRSGLTLTATYNNGTTKTITSGFTCTPTALNTAGTQKITVTYGGKTTYFNVTVTDNTPSENDPQFAVSNSKASKSNTVDVTVSVKNNPGIIAAKLNISYDTSKLKLTKVTNGAVMGSSLFDPGNDLTASPYSVCWNDMDSNHSGDGVMVTFTFEIAENAEIGVVPVTLTYDTGSTFNSDLENVSFATVSGSVEITDRTPGDTNGDNEIDLKDVVLIRRYLSGGWNVTINESNADVNQDGYVDLKDVVIIRRYLSGGWNVTLK